MTNVADSYEEFGYFNGSTESTTNILHYMKLTRHHPMANKRINQ